MVLDLRRLRREVAAPLVGRWVEAKLAVLALITGENLVLISRPGTGKTRLLRHLSTVVGAGFYSYTLTADTAPSMFVPKLAAADIGFLDEIFNANSDTLNSLLELLAEKVYRVGGEIREARLWSCFAASNVTPRDLGRKELEALYDRFTFRHFMEYVELSDIDLVVRSWLAEERGTAGYGSGYRVPLAAVKAVRGTVLEAAARIVSDYSHVLRRVVKALRETGVLVTDRRIPKYVLAVAAHAVFRGYPGTPRVDYLDFYVAKYVFPETEGDLDLAAEALAKSLPRPVDYVADLAARADAAEELGEDELAELYAEAVEAADLLPHEELSGELRRAAERVKAVYRSRGHKRYLI